MTNFRRNECCFEVKPKDVFSVTLTIIHNKGTASTEVKEFQVPGTCTCTLLCSFVYVHLIIMYY